MKLGRAATEKAAAVLHPGRQTAATVLRAITQQRASSDRMLSPNRARGGKLSFGRVLWRAR